MSILTTHVGSLPRTQETVDFIFARERQEPYDRGQAQHMRAIGGQVGGGGHGWILSRLSR